MFMTQREEMDSFFGDVQSQLDKLTIVKTPFTYRTLFNKLSQLSEEQLNQTVTVYACEMDEFYPCEDMLITDEREEVLDCNHAYITLS